MIKNLDYKNIVVNNSCCYEVTSQKEGCMEPLDWGV